VVKGHLSHGQLKDWKVPIIHGGSPIIMSRAAVQHVAPQFPHVCTAGPYQTDDNAFTLIMSKVFDTWQSWADVRFAGPIATAEPHYKFLRGWDIFARKRFRNLKQVCTINQWFLKPWKAIVGVHTNGCRRQWIAAIEAADSDIVPNDLMVEWIGGVGYVFCHGNDTMLRWLTSTDFKNVTPLVELSDSRLQYSFRDIAQLAVATCHRWGRANCVALSDRVRSINI
jgi:hypothetical protein